MKLIELLATVAAMTCSLACATPPTLAAAKRADVAAPRARSSRWVRTNHRAMIGPRVAGGTLVLLGGRRAVVAADGRVAPERVAAPEALWNIVAVPTPEGPVIVGLGGEHLYRFDDPLGAATPIVDLCGPSMRSIDVRGGFVAITLEQGVSGVDPRTGARVCGRSPRECWPNRGRSATECPPASSAAPEQTKVAPGAVPLLRWITATGADPLALAVTDGARLDEDTAVVASHGLIARVDLAHGTIAELTTYDEKRPGGAGGEACASCSGRMPFDNGPCEVARAGRDLWLLCPYAGERTIDDDRLMPFAAFDLRAKTKGLTAKPVRTFEVVGRDPGKHLVAASGAGGWLLEHPCNVRDPDAFYSKLCVRQPDGSMSTFAGAAGSSLPNERLSGLFPLADGRLAGLFGTPYGQGGPDANAKPIRVETLGPTGDRATLPALPVAFTNGASVQLTSMDEVGGALDLALQETWYKDKAGAMSPAPAVQTGWFVRQPLDGGAAAARRVPGATALAMGRGHAIAFVDTERVGRIVVSNDGGATVFEEDAPPGMRMALRAVAGDVGAFFEGGPYSDGWLRIGWDPLGAP